MWIVDCTHIYTKRSDKRKSKKDLSGSYRSFMLLTGIT